MKRVTKILDGKTYLVDVSDCTCGCDEIEYTVNEKVAEKFWGQGRKAEWIMSKELKQAQCPRCNCLFGFDVQEVDADKVI